MAFTPPRRRMASWRPPPGEARSRKNRKASRRLDLPDAFGPTRNIRFCMETSVVEKFFQFRSRRRENFSLVLFVDIGVVSFANNGPAAEAVRAGGDA